jgi:hypothetical protein
MDQPISLEASSDGARKIRGHESLQCWTVAILVRLV